MRIATIPAHLFEQREWIALETVRVRNVLEAVALRLRRLEEAVKMHRSDADFIVNEVVTLDERADERDVAERLLDDARALSSDAGRLESRVRDALNEIDRFTALRLASEMQRAAVQAVDKRGEYC